MSFMNELYKDIILDHYQNPRNFGIISDAHIHETGVNPLCGDEIEIFLSLKDDKIKDVKFKGVGCSISQASASMMCEVIQGKKINEVLLLIKNFKEILLEEEREFDLDEEFYDLESLMSVKKIPVRIKCSVLSWNVLERSLNQIN